MVSDSLTAVLKNKNQSCRFSFEKMLNGRRVKCAFFNDTAVQGGIAVSTFIFIQLFYLCDLLKKARLVHGINLQQDMAYIL